MLALGCAERKTPKTKSREIVLAYDLELFGIGLKIGTSDYRRASF